MKSRKSLIKISVSDDDGTVVEPDPQRAVQLAHSVHGPRTQSAGIPACIHADTSLRRDVRDLRERRFAQIFWRKREKVYQRSEIRAQGNERREQTKEIINSETGRYFGL